ncbi:MAG: dephospho-CoA kinase [Acidobacteria bacterium]|nr:MAG: dephospho-CoA kinase [Acidobacteriota bacterium]
MLHVGLTGNIASGKSCAARVFAELGAHIIDADLIAHDLLTPGKPTYEKVREAFGGNIVLEDGSINRRKLGEIVFNDAAQRALLNSLMVESGLYKLYDKLVVVHCHPALQLARLVSRDGLSVKEARARMAAQMPVEEKLQVADYKIDTSGTFRQTREQVEGTYRELVLLEVSRQAE